MSNTDLIILKNSNPLNKYPVDAEQLNHNFQVLLDKTGAAAIERIIESTGQTYESILTTQLAAAVAQYALSSQMFSERGSGNDYVLYAKDGLIGPVKYTEGMFVSFKTTHANTSGVSLRINTLPAYPILKNGSELTAGAIVTNEILTFRFRGTYWEPVSYDGSSSGQVTPSGGGGDSSTAEYAYGSIVAALATAGISLDTKDLNQLGQAIANYSKELLYLSSYAGNVYNLLPFGSFSGITEYMEGQVFAFVADAENDSDVTLLSINGNTALQMVDHNGVNIAQGTILAGDFVYGVYSNSQFYVYSLHKSSLSLTTGPSVNEISTDALLANVSDTSLATTAAIKGYVDSKIQGANPDVILTGYKDENGNAAALHSVDGNVIQLISSYADSNTAIKEVQSTDQSDIIASGNTIYKHNIINKIEETYWPSEKEGFAVDGIKREVAGPSGNKYIQTVISASGVPTYIGDPCYIGISNMSELPNVIRIKHTSANTTPQTIKFQIRFSTDITFYDVVSSTGSYEYGNLELQTPDADGYYNIPFPTHYLNGVTITPITLASGSVYALKIVATLFNNQEVSDSLVNSDGYDPNNDTESPRYAWCVEDVIVGVHVDSPTFRMVYGDKTIGELQGPRYITQYVSSEPAEEEEPDENLTELDTVENGGYYIYHVYGNEQLDMLDEQSVYKSVSNPIPAPTEDNEGSMWIDTSTVPATIKILTEFVAEDETVYYEWVAQNAILVGYCTYTNNRLTNLITFRYGKDFGTEYPMTATFDRTIAHNYGTDVDVYCQLVCTVANNSYAVGDMITLDNNITSVYSLPTVDEDGIVTDVGANTLSYFQVVNTQMSTRIKSYNLYIVNRNNNTLVQLPANQWKLRVYLTKD